MADYKFYCRTCPFKTNEWEIVRAHEAGIPGGWLGHDEKHTMTCTAHEWWHAGNVNRHLVCGVCGLGMHDIEPGQHPAHEQLMISGSGVKLVPCRIHPVASDVR